MVQVEPLRPDLEVIDVGLANRRYGIVVVQCERGVVNAWGIATRVGAVNHRVAVEIMLKADIAYDCRRVVAAAARIRTVGRCYKLILVVAQPVGVVAQARYERRIRRKLPRHATVDVVGLRVRLDEVVDRRRREGSKLGKPDFDVRIEEPEEITDVLVNGRSKLDFLRQLFDVDQLRLGVVERGPARRRPRRHAGQVQDIQEEIRERRRNVVREIRRQCEQVLDVGLGLVLVAGSRGERVATKAVFQRDRAVGVLHIGTGLGYRAVVLEVRPTRRDASHQGGLTHRRLDRRREHVRAGAE